MLFWFIPEFSVGDFVGVGFDFISKYLFRIPNPFPRFYSNANTTII
jgi:hypothetical protein